MHEAIRCRDKSIRHRAKLESKKKADTEELNKLNAGKKTFKTIFKSKSGTQAQITTLSSNISQLEKDIEEMDKLVKMIEVHLGETVIPHFKETQMNYYHSICQEFAILEREDNNKMVKYWDSFLENNNINPT